MDKARQQEYIELVQALLECEGGTETDILQTHSDLVDAGLVMTLRGVAQMMMKQNDPERESTIEWLTNFANQLAQGLGLEPDANSDETESHFKFLMSVFRAIAESSGNPQVVYPLFRDNLPLLNEELIPMLKTWHQAKFAEIDEDGRQITTLTSEFANLIQQFPLGSRLINLEIAIDCYRLALEIYTHAAFPEDWARTQMNLANAYQHRIRGGRAENLEQSIGCLQLALEIYTHAAFPEQWAMTQMSLANAYGDRIQGERAKNLEQSIGCLQLALEIRTSAAFPEDWAGTQMNLANAYRSRIKGERAANLEESIACYRLALEIYTRAAFPEQWAKNQNNLATSYQEIDRVDKAIECFQSALEILTPELLPLACVTTANNLGNLYFKQGNWQLAIDAYDRAIQAVETSRTWATTEDERQRLIREAISVYENTIQAHINLGDIAQAITTSERARSRQLVDFMRTRDLYADGEIPTEIATYLTEYAALECKIKEQTSSDSTLDRNQGESPNRQLTTSTRDSRALAAVSEKVKGLEAQKQAVWRKIRALDPEIADRQQVTPIDLAAIQALIKTPDTAILSFYTTDDDTHIFILTHNQPPQIHTCSGQGYQELQLWLKASWLNVYTTDDKNKYNWRSQMATVLQELPDRLQLDTLISKLDNITDLIIIPHLHLHQIPFAALPIFDKFTIRYAPGCQILKYCDDRPALEKTQHGAIENADGTLPGAGFEVGKIAKIFKIDLEYRLQGRQQATIDGFNALMKKFITTLHLAHHAQSRLDDPLQSALQLADGDITLERLLFSRYPHLHEVFLSCCETHLGTTKITDDILTIATGFLCAGARSVISTLWAVDDLATALFSIFYYNNRYDGYSRAKSLKMAQVRLRNFTGEEFKLNYRDDLEAHLNAYGKANKAERKEITAQFDRGEIDQVTFDRDKHRLTDAYEAAVELINRLDQYCQTDRPFAEQYYWAAFTCQGLA